MARGRLGAAAAASSSSAAATDGTAAPSTLAPRRRLPPALLLLASLAALLLLSSRGDAGATVPLRDVSLENPKVDFIPSSLGGQFCERIRLSGMSRLSLGSYSNRVRVSMNVSESLPEKFHWKIEVCFHGNISTGLCQCELGEWQVLQNGQWSAVKSPYGNKYLDVKVNDRISTSFSISTQEEFQKWRLACLGIGFLLMFLAPIVSKWVPFYYTSSMALGVLLVVLIVIFQGMKLLPMGKKSFLYLTIYGSVLGIGSYVVHYFSTLVSSILENFGLGEEMHNPVSVFLLVAIVLSGAGFGYWMVRKFVLSGDGSVDAGIAQFVKWAMRIVAACFVIQSTLDPFLALVAVAATCCICSLMTREAHKQIILKNICQTRGIQMSPGNRKVQFLTPSGGMDVGKAVSGTSATQNGWANFANRGLVYSSLTKRVVPNRDEDHYSTFHKIQPRKYSKQQWEDFTQESTRKAMMECASTPEFAKWVTDNAHRLRVDHEIISEDDTGESCSDSSEETAEENGDDRRLLRWY